MSDLIVGVRELKAQLSEYLRRVKAGQSVVITERGQPIGRIVPEAASLDRRMQILIQAGMVSWNGQKLMPRDLNPIRQLGEVHGEKLVSDLVTEGREIDYLFEYQRPD